MKKTHMEILSLLIISTIFVVILLNKIIISPGYILWGDMALPIDSDKFVVYHTAVWDSINSMSGIENFGRLFARIPFILLAYIGVDIGIIEKLMFISLYLIGIFSAYFFLRRVINLEHLPSIFLSLSFVLFLHFFQYLSEYSAVFGGMIFPAIFSFFYLGLNYKKLSYIIMCGILMITTIQMPFTFLIGNLILLAYMIYMLVSSKKISILSLYIFFVVIQLAVGSFYFIPLFLNPPSPESISSNVVTFEEIISLGDMEYYFNPIIGFPIKLFNLERFSLYSNIILNKLQLILSMVLLGILPFFALTRKKDGLSIFLFILLLAFWQMSLGGFGLLTNLYTTTVTENSILNFLRSPMKFYLFIPFSTLGLLGILFKSIEKTRIQIIVSILFIISILFISVPSIISWNNNLKPIQIPGEFNNIQKIVYQDIQDSDGYFRTIWYPEYLSTGTIWAPHNGILPFDQRSSKVPIYSYYRSGIRQDLIFGDYIWNLLADNQTKSASYRLYQYRVKYIIFHDDLRIAESKKVLSNLLSSGDFELASKQNFMYLFKIKNYKNINYFYIGAETPILMESFNLQNGISNDIRHDYFFLDDGFNGTMDIFSLSKIIVATNFSNYLNSLIYTKLHKYGSYYYPGKQTFHNNIKAYWSVKNGWEIKPRFNNYVEDYIDKSYDNYQLDFGQRVAVTSGKNVLATYNITINKQGKYIIVSRLFGNVKGGNIEVQVDEKSYTVDTLSGINKFEWVELGTVNLDSGDHSLLLKNINGFNAVNIFGLIFEDDYYSAKKEITELFDNKTIIYFFEAESDIYKTNADISTKYRDASNGKALVFDKNGKAWQDIEIIKNGTYIIALRSRGNIKASIGDKTFGFTSDSLDFTYSTLYLKEGTYRLEIRPVSSNAILDAVWLYETETNQTIYQIFEAKEQPAEIISYKYSGTNQWNVKVNAIKPFMLSVTESYDPMWEAVVYNDGKKVEVINPVPIYSLINGFWINETGNLEIIIRYKRQEMFNIGLVISIITLICCIVYLIKPKILNRKYALKNLCTIKKQDFTKNQVVVIILIIIFVIFVSIYQPHYPELSPPAAPIINVTETPQVNTTVSPESNASTPLLHLSKNLKKLVSILL